MNFFLIKTAVYVGVSSIAGLLIFFACVDRRLGRELRNRLIALHIYSVAIAFLSPNILVFHLAAGLIVPIFAPTRRLIAPVFVFALLFLPAPSIRVDVGGIYLLSMNSVIAVIIGATAICVLRGERNRPGLSLPGVCLAVIFLVLLFPSVRSTTGTNFVRAFLQASLGIILPFYIIKRSVRNLDDVRFMLIGLLAAGAALATLAMYEAWAGWPLFRVVSEHFGVDLTSGASVKMRGGLLRAPGPYPEPLSLAFELCIATLLAFTSRWMFRAQRMHYVVIALLMGGMFSPQSKAAWLGLACGMLIYGMVTGKVASLIKISIFVPLMGALTYLIGYSVPLIGNMLGLNTVGAASKDYRQLLLERGWQEAQKHLLFGQTLDLVTYSLRDLVQGEGIVDFVNQYLFVLLTTGLVGLAPFIIAILSPIMYLWGYRAKFHQRGLSELAFTGGAIGSIAVMITFTSFIGRAPMTLSLLMALASIFSQIRPGATKRVARVKHSIALGTAVRPPTGQMVQLR